MRNCLGYSTFLIGMMGAALPGSAAAIITGDVADRTIRKDGTRANTLTGRVGASTSGTSTAWGCRAAVFVFQLPAPGPGEQATVLSAELQFTVVADWTDGAYNIDLYGLGARPSYAVFSTDNYAGSLDMTDASLIQNNIVPAAHPDGGVEVVLTDAGGNSELVKYLNAQYGANGAGTGRYVFFRLNPDVDPPVEDTGVDVAFADNPTNQPQLTIAFVPEPSVWAYVAPVALSLMKRPHRQRRVTGLS